MATGRGLSYAAYFAGWFLTWPIIGYMGAQGYTGLVAFLAIPVLAFARPQGLPRYVLAFGAFIGWVVAASFWSPGGKPFISGSFGAGSFTMDMVGARVGLTALACVAMLMAIAQVKAGGATRSLLVIRWVGLVQMFGVLVTAVLMQPIIDFIISTGQSDQSNMMQNLLRNANALLLMVPFLLAWAWQAFPPRLPRGVIVAVLGLLFGAFALTGTQSAMFGSIFMLGAMALVWKLPRRGFRVLLGGLAAYIMVAPVLLVQGLGLLRHLGVPLPHSFMSRGYSWQLVQQKIAEKPLLGHGLEASHDWQDTYSDHPSWLAEIIAAGGDEAAWSIYRVTPTHPHNMALQIWADTGVIGASLFALALVTLAWRLPPPAQWPTVSRYAAAGLIGVVAAMFSFAYSMWNEAFWASVAVAAGVVLLQARQDAQS